MRHQIRTYETLALTTRPECMQYQQSHAFGPHSMCLGWQKRAKQKSQPYTDDTAHVEVCAVAKVAQKVTAHSMLRKGGSDKSAVFMRLRWRTGGRSEPGQA